MPSRVVTMTSATMELATERKNAKIKPSFILVDNAGASADAVLQFQDVFTQAITHGTPTQQSATTKDRLRVTVDHGGYASLDDELKDVEFLGLVQVVRGESDDNCHITFGYDFI